MKIQKKYCYLSRMVISGSVIVAMIIGSMILEPITAVAKVPLVCGNECLGKVVITSALNPACCLEVKDASSDNYGNILLSSSISAENQQFYLYPSQEGYFRFQACHSGLFMDAEGGKGNKGDNIIQYQENSRTRAQQFRLEPCEGDYYIIRSLAGNGDMVLDVEGGHSASGTNIRLWKENGTDAQKFNVSFIDEINQENLISSPISTGNYQIINNSDTRYLNTFSDIARSFQYGVVACPADNSLEQTFSVELQNNGTYFFSSRNYGGRSIRSEGGAFEGDKVVSGGKYSSFTIEDAGNGSYYIKDAFTKLVLTETAIPIYDGVYVTYQTKNGNSNQKWSFIPLNDNIANSIDGMRVVEDARKYLGLGYVWGGNSLENGVDCSGFVCALYEKYGINLWDNRGTLVYAGTKISKTEAMPGDLIHYPGHIGIYTGNDKMISALTAGVEEINIYQFYGTTGPVNPDYYIRIPGIN